MAKKETKVVPEKKTKKKPGRFGVFAFLLIFIFATPFMMPTVVLILIGLIPSYVALATDNDPQKSGAISVSAMNLAGLVPFIIDLWTKGQTMGNALQILANANSWIVILGASAVGQLIVSTIPQALAALTFAQAESRIKSLQKNLEMLKEAWGPEVASNKSVD